MSEKRELFADIIVGVMTGDKNFVQDKLLLLDPAELDHFLQGLEWLPRMCIRIKDVENLEELMLKITTISQRQIAYPHLSTLEVSYYHALPDDLEMHFPSY